MRPLALALLALPLASRAAEPHPRFLEMVEPLGSVGTVRPRHRPESQRLPHWARGLRGGGAPPAAAPSRVLRPAAFGADPTGKADSAAAFDRLLAAAWSAPVGRFTNGPDTAAVVDLEGGVYSLSRPLVFPAAGGGGLAMRDGVLRATPDFPMGAESALLLLTSTNGTNADGLCCWYEYIYFTNLVLDAGLRAGCARVHTATRIVFDEVFFTGFRTVGLYYGGISTGKPSHQLLLSRSFFGTTDWRGGSHPERCETLSHEWGNIGLALDGPDNQIEDCVFFCSGIGIKLSGPSNYFEGIHAYNGGTCLDVAAMPTGHYPPGNEGPVPTGQHGNRFDHCYWDYCGVRIENPYQIEFSNNYLLGTVPKFFELVALGKDIAVQGLRVTGSVFRSAPGGGPSTQRLLAFAINETSGNFARGNLTNSLVAGNSFVGVTGAATQLRASKTQSAAATEWTFDLCSSTLFGHSVAEPTVELFAHLQYSLRLVSGARTLPSAAITGVKGCSVTVATSEPVVGTVYLEADQSRDAFGADGSAVLL